jgi:hypothetical protein
MSSPRMTYTDIGEFLKSREFCYTMQALVNQVGSCMHGHKGMCAVPLRGTEGFSRNMDLPGNRGLQDV